MNKYLNNKIYLLYHMYEYGADNENEENKTLGIYSSEKEAFDAIERYYKLDGFKKHPKECFGVDEYEMDVDTGWKEGFVNSDELEQDFEILTNCFNQWQYNGESPQESWQNEVYYNALCDVSGVMYKVQDIKELAESIQQIWIKRFGDKTKSFDKYIQIATNIKKNLLAETG